MNQHGSHDWLSILYLPDLPPAPRMTEFPSSINLAADTLPAFNAMGQGLAPNAPRPPAPPQMPKSHKSFQFPAGRGHFS